MDKETTSNLKLCDDKDTDMKKLEMTGILVWFAILFGCGSFATTTK